MRRNTHLEAPAVVLLLQVGLRARQRRPRQRLVQPWVPQRLRRREALLRVNHQQSRHQLPCAAQKDTAALWQSRPSDARKLGSR